METKEMPNTDMPTYRIEYINEFGQLTHCFRQLANADDIYDELPASRVKKVEIAVFTEKELKNG